MAEPGRLVGPYRLLSKLGKGGMGEVWRARDERLDRYVALKMLPSKYAADPERRARMLREARASAGVPHPNVVTLFDVFSEGGEDFLVMELVEGKTLLDWVSGAGSVDTERAVDMLIATTDALTAAHDKGILHRDIKSSNIMVDDQGAIKILDFGLAKLRGQSDPLPARPSADDDEDPDPVTQESVGFDDTLASVEPRPSGQLDTGDYLETAMGSLLGTPRYMAPEQTGGGELDERSEVFSVGIVAYELLTGSTPYDAKDLEELFAQIKHQPVQLPGDVPGELAAVVRKAVEKKPDARHQAMAELRDDLRRVKALLFAPARPPKWPWIVGSAALVAVAVVATVLIAGGDEAAAPRSPGDQYVDQALREYNLFYGPKATSSLRAAVKHDADHPRAYAYLLLFGGAEPGEKRNAVTQSARLLDALPESRGRDRALLSVAIALETKGPKAARAALSDSGVKLDPELAFWSAELAYKSRDYESADREFRALLSSGGDAFRGRIYDHFSAVLLYFDKAGEAVDIGKAYAEAFSGEADALGVYATTLAAAGQFDEALEYAKEALRLNEGEDTLAGLAKVHAYRGELSEARLLYEKAVILARPGRRVLRRAAIALLYYIDADLQAARAAVAPCLPGGEDAAVPERAACLWVAAMIDPEQTAAVIGELEKLESSGSELSPPYGFPGNLAALLRAQQRFFGGGCLGEPAADIAVSRAGAAEIRKLLERGRDFYAQYHLPYFGSYTTCELSALDRETGDTAAAAARTAPFSAPLRNGLVVIEHARNQRATAPAAAQTTLRRLRSSWKTLDPDSAVRKRIDQLMAP